MAADSEQANFEVETAFEVVGEEEGQREAEFLLAQWEDEVRWEPAGVFVRSFKV